MTKRRSSYFSAILKELVTNSFKKVSYMAGILEQVALAPIFAITMLQQASTWGISNI